MRKIRNEEYNPVGDVSAKPITLPANIKRQAQKELGIVLKPTYFSEIPIQDIQDALERYGVYMVDEEGSIWSGFLMGDDSQADFDLMYEGRPVGNSMLRLSWYKMSERSGKYEVIGYLS